MKLWLLKARRDLPKEDNPWDPWYDKCFGMVVIASTRKEARLIAHRNAGDENRGEFLDEIISKTTRPWLHPKYSTCVELKPPYSKEEVILKDFKSA